MSVPLVSAVGLRKAFPIWRGGLSTKPAGEVVAVDDVSFDVLAGETLGCVGGSGSGKSTLGRLILNLLRADAGEVRFDGVNLAALPPAQMRPYRRDLQIVFQDPLQSLNSRRTVAENVARPMLNFGAGRGEAKERVQHLLEVVGLNPQHANRYPHEFSGGQCQRVGIARALALQPRFLFLDEPVSALDVSIQAQILNLLQELQERFRLTYLFVSHDLNVVKQVSDRILVLYHGNAVELGDSEEVYHRPKHPYTRTLLNSVLGIEGGDAWERVATRARFLDDTEDVASALSAAEAARTRCVYADNCPDRFEPCVSSPPQLREGEAGRFVACHLHDPPPRASA